jgi:hypothetical protein
MLPHDASAETMKEALMTVVSTKNYIEIFDGSAESTIVRCRQ